MLSMFLLNEVTLFGICHTNFVYITRHQQMQHKTVKCTKEFKYKGMILFFIDQSLY